MRRAETPILFQSLVAATAILSTASGARLAAFEQPHSRNSPSPEITSEHPTNKTRSKTPKTVFSSSTTSIKSETTRKPDSTSPSLQVTTTMKRESKPTTTRPVATTTIPNHERVETPSWSRQETVRRLKEKGVFSAPYSTMPIVSDPEGDLSNPAKSTNELVDAAKDLEALSEQNGFQYVIRLVKTGHDPKTSNGKISDHSLGRAFDVSFSILPAWIQTDPFTPPLPNQIITNNSSATKSANKIMGFLFQHPEKYNQVIWAGSDKMIEHGKIIPTSAKKGWPELAISHQDHIHISVNSKSSAHAVTQNASAFASNYSSDIYYTKPRELQAA